MPDALRRGTRTFLDIAFVEAILQLIIAFGVDFTEAQHAAVLVVAPFFISAIKNALEDAGAIPALLKAPPSPGEHPIPDPESGHTDAQLLVLAVIAALVAVIAALVAAIAWHLIVR